jgi:hypothetical protein
MQFNLPQQFWGRCEPERAEGAPRGCCRSGSKALAHAPGAPLPGPPPQTTWGRENSIALPPGSVGGKSGGGVPCALPRLGLCARRARSFGPAGSGVNVGCGGAGPQEVASSFGRRVTSLPRCLRGRGRERGALRVCADALGAHRNPPCGGAGPQEVASGLGGASPLPRAVCGGEAGRGGRSGHAPMLSERIAIHPAAGQALRKLRRALGGASPLSRAVCGGEAGRGGFRRMRRTRRSASARSRVPRGPPFAAVAGAPSCGWRGSRRERSGDDDHTWGMG